MNFFKEDNQSAFDAKDRELVRHDTKLPARLVGSGVRAAIGEELTWRHLLVSVAERARRIGRDVHRLQAKVAVTLAPFGGNDDPAAGDGIFAELRQV